MTESVEIVVKMASPEDAVEEGLAMFKAGDFAKAEIVFRGVLDSIPGHFDAMHMLGLVLVEQAGRPGQQQRWYEALYRFDRALRLRPMCSMTRTNLGMVLSTLGHHDEAVDMFNRSLDINRSNAVTWGNLGHVLERMGKYERAVNAYDRSLELDETSALTHCNRGISLLRLNRHQEGLAAFERSLVLAPDDADAHYNKATCLLLLGDLDHGFAEYEWRLKTNEHAPYYIQVNAPMWKGESLEGKNILVHAEQGLGDTIMFARYLDLVLERNPAKVWLVAHREIRPLLRNMYPAIEVLEPGSVRDEIDYYVPMLSLPAVFRTTAETVPEVWSVSERPGRCDDCARWREIMTGTALKTRFVTGRTMDERDVNRRKAIESVIGEEVGFRVGVCWSGNERHKNDAARSIPLEVFRPIIEAAGSVYSLQKDVRLRDQVAFKSLSVIDLAPHLTDLRQTAHAMGWLDLVITCDTAVAHLAATMDVETWILLPDFSTDWRWQRGRTDSPWYPSARLFRQGPGQKWEPVIAAVVEALAKRMGRIAA